MTDLKRGFITVATGDYYCWLAQNLAMSYRLFSERTYPLYAITDKKGKAKLEKYFDGVVVLEHPHYNFLDKIEVYYNSPFEETVFLDADMSIIKDISFVFDYFSNNGSEISCYGVLRNITDEEPPIHFGRAAVQAFGLKQYMRFGGGIYYYKKSPKAEAVMEFVYNDLIPNYDKYELLHIGAYFGNDIKRMADEPLMGLAIVAKGMKPINEPNHFMRFYRGNMMETFDWNMDKKDCSFYWWGETVHPHIAHYATYNTYTRKYYLNSARFLCRYYKISKIICPIVSLYYNIKWVISDNTRKEAKEWFMGHFTKEWIKYRVNKIKTRRSDMER